MTPKLIYAASLLAALTLCTFLTRLGFHPLIAFGTGFIAIPAVRLVCAWAFQVYGIIPLNPESQAGTTSYSAVNAYLAKLLVVFATSMLLALMAGLMGHTAPVALTVYLVANSVLRYILNKRLHMPFIDS